MFSDCRHRLRDDLTSVCLPNNSEVFSTVATADCIASRVSPIFSLNSTARDCRRSVSTALKGVLSSSDSPLNQNSFNCGISRLLDFRSRVIAPSFAFCAGSVMPSLAAVASISVVRRLYRMFSSRENPAISNPFSVGVICRPSFFRFSASADKNTLSRYTVSSTTNPICAALNRFSTGSYVTLKTT